PPARGNRSGGAAGPEPHVAVEELLRTDHGARFGWHGLAGIKPRLGEQPIDDPQREDANPPAKESAALQAWGEPERVTGHRVGAGVPRPRWHQTGPEVSPVLQ